IITGDLTVTGDVSITQDLQVGQNANVTGKLTASNLSGTNTGDVTLVPIGALPNANGASLVNQVLNLQPASTAFGGVVSTTLQGFAGNKSFQGSVDVGGFSMLSGAGAGKVLTSDAGGVGTWQTPSSGQVEITPWVVDGS